MTNEIKLLHASLLDDDNKLKELTYWLRVMNRPNGWHYDLDHIWILNELEKSGIHPGSTIVDAGAGQGILQYLLASRGYNIISLDFSPRTRPGRSMGIFDIRGQGNSDINYQHPYMKFIKYGVGSSTRMNGKFNSSSLRKFLLLPQRAMRHAISVAYYLIERIIGNHAGYGPITYLRAPFHDVPLASESVDAVISVSAIEHADISLFSENIKELLRLMKPGAPLLLTTSATASDDNNYHEKSSGWCFSLSALKTLFPDCQTEFNAEDCAHSLTESKAFMDRLDPYYYQDRDSFCYKKRITGFPYLPVGVKIVK
jgi:2-polyprenyl-3-methyl-5-hydroxy-6-metoxy-1,4-benzoquinol methylase